MHCSKVSCGSKLYVRLSTSTLASFQRFGRVIHTCSWTHTLFLLHPKTKTQGLESHNRLGSCPPIAMIYVDVWSPDACIPYSAAAAATRSDHTGENLQLRSTASRRARSTEAPHQYNSPRCSGVVDLIKFEPHGRIYCTRLVSGQYKH